MEGTVIANRAQVLQDWAEHYANLHCQIIDSHGLGLSGVSASRILAKIPESLILSSRTIGKLALQDSTLKKWLAIHPVSGQHYLHRALVYLALISCPDQWVVYFKLLPANADIHLPFSWEEEDLNSLQTSSIYDATLAKKRLVELQYQDFVVRAKEVVDTDIPFPLWVLVYQWVASRTLEHPETGESTMVPLVDLCNHRSPANARYEFDNGFVLLPAEEFSGEIFLDYGESKGSGELLFNYGFLPDREISSRILRLYDPLDESVRSLLDPSRDPDCPPEEVATMAAAYDLLTQFLPDAKQALVLEDDGQWHDEFLLLVACEDLVELRLVEDKYGLYIENVELIPGEIEAQTQKYPIVATRAIKLVADMAEHFASNIDGNSGNEIVDRLLAQELSLYRKFAYLAKD